MFFFPGTNRVNLRSRAPFSISPRMRATLSFAMEIIVRSSTPVKVQHGHCLLLQLAASPCSRRSKTQLLTSDAFSLAQLYQVDRAGLGCQCIAPSTVNLGLTIHTGWACSIQADQMEYCPLVRTAPSLLSKQLLKFRTRIAAGNKGNLSTCQNHILQCFFAQSVLLCTDTSILP